LFGKYPDDVNCPDEHRNTNPGTIIIKRAWIKLKVQALVISKDEKGLLWKSCLLLLILVTEAASPVLVADKKDGTVFFVS